MLQAVNQAQIQLTLASFERRRQGVDLSVSLAKQDVAIGAQQVTLAVDAVDIVQEKVIAETRNTHAKDTVAFLANKFTNVELYDWMSDVLEVPTASSYKRGDVHCQTRGEPVGVRAAGAAGRVHSATTGRCPTTVS